MRQSRIVRPVYAERFRCIGSDCEDSCCCQDWRVDIDRAAYEKYQTIPPGALRTLIDDCVIRSTEVAAASHPDYFAQIRVSPSTPCPLLSADRLCRMQTELGETYLPKVCASYPRRIHTIDSLEESPLSLSCPEAARLVLLDPDLLASNEARPHEVHWDDGATAAHGLRYYFWPLREFSLGLVRNRAYPLWQRMFLLGSFSRRLNAFAQDPSNRGLPAFLRDFSAAVDAGTLRSSMNGIPADLALQFDFLLRLVAQHLNAVNRNPRMVETLQAFIRGVGYGSEATIEGQRAQYAAAYERYFAPFVLKHPHILENYLLNMIFYRLFPLGAMLFDTADTPEPEREFAELAIQFALIKGLLIGVAGHYHEAFSTRHVIQAVQTAFKHFDHNREFLDQAYRLLTERDLNNARGLTMLLRN